MGALQHAAKRGVNFSGVAGTSAGSIIAAFLAAGATADQIGSVLEQLDFREFLKPPDLVVSNVSFLQKTIGTIGNFFYPGVSSILENYGLYSSRQIEDWLDRELKQLLPQVAGKKEKVKFKDFNKPLWIVAADIVTQNVKIWSKDQNPNDSVAYAVRCSCSIPGFFQAVDRHYVDGGLLSNLPSFTFSKEEGAVHSRKILAFTLQGDVDDVQLDTPKSYFKAVIDTAIDGGANIQERLVENVYEIPIPTGRISSTDFEGMNAEKTKLLVANGMEAARQFF